MTGNQISWSRLAAGGAAFRIGMSIKTMPLHDTMSIAPECLRVKVDIVPKYTPFERVSFYGL